MDSRITATRTVAILMLAGTVIGSVAYDGSRTVGALIKACGQHRGTADYVVPVSAAGMASQAFILPGTPTLCSPRRPES